MGLDMYVRTTKVAPPKDVDFEIDHDNSGELFYWRKHPDLHGWMEQLYMQKGGTDPDFNVKPLRLTAEDIDLLERDLDVLPHTTGFFFGQSQPEDREQTEAFIALARAQFAEGQHIYYYAWW